MQDRIKRMIASGFFLTLFAGALAQMYAQDLAYQYKVLATTKTSTMKKELNDAAAAGFRFAATMGGETAFGGKESVVVMIKDLSKDASEQYVYELLATNKTGTMQKEMTKLAEEGYEYKGQTVFKSTFGGQEVCVIMERNKSRAARSFEYKLLATSKTSTMEKELLEAGSAGFRLVGMTVAETAFGGNELVSILEKEPK